MKHIFLFLTIYYLFVIKEYACILGGTSLNPGNAPYQVALFSRKQLICSGTLISRSWIASAAKCARHKKYKAKLGVTNLAAKESHTLLRKIDRVIMHQGYNELTEENNVALFKLEEPIKKFTQYIKSIRLADSVTHKVLDDESAVLTGWGETGFLSSSTNILKKVDLKIQNNKMCGILYMLLLTGIPPAELCTHATGMGTNGLKGACYSDIGAPLVFNDTEPILIGIVKAPPPLCVANLPTVYTRISAFRPWIEQYVALDEEDDDEDESSREKGPNSGDDNAVDDGYYWPLRGKGTS